MLVAALPFLSLIFSSALASAMIVPFMGYYIVEGLGQQPWMITVYTGFAALLTVSMNRWIAKRLDTGSRFKPLLLVASISFLAATVAMVVDGQLASLLSVGLVGFGLSNTAMVIMFTYGRSFADGRGIEPNRFNAWLRATTSLAWMVGPALSFGLVYQLGVSFVFQACMTLGIVWLVLVLRIVPAQEARDLASNSEGSGGADSGLDRQLWLASMACFFFAVAHLLCSAALPLFYVQEAGLPSYAAGLSFSVKTAVEIVVILNVPRLMVLASARHLLMANSLLAIVAFGVLSMVDSMPVMVIGASLEGLYYGLFAGVSGSFVQSFAGDRMGRATSFYVNALFFGGLVAGPAVGLIAQFWDFRTSILLASVAALAALLILAVMRPDPSPANPPAAQPG
ncbi:MAG: MFS transporter [Cohaesibacteraceae bacterium]